MQNLRHGLDVAVAQRLVLPCPRARQRPTASCFVNPLTALGMVDTMQREGHSALVHTAAASNLGQMLNRICQKDDIALVNIVRKQEQADLLKAMGATWMCVTSSSTFLPELTEALAATGATIAFDATGGGKLAGQILGCMEAALARKTTEYSRYGTSTLKQAIYGGLDTGPTEFNRNFGFARSMGGGAEDHLCQPLRPRDLAVGGTRSGHDRPLQPARHGREASDQSGEETIQFLGVCSAAK